MDSNRDLFDEIAGTYKREVIKMSSRWSHSICEDCWNKGHPDREAVRIREEYRDEKPIPCCYCSRPHQSGIYVRDDPATLRCYGVHPDG